jgi:hypothetical protein
MPLKVSRLSVIETALAAIVQRVNVLERRHRSEPLELIEPQSAGDRRLSKKALAERWGMSQRTIDRMREKPDFPVPDIVNKACLWWLSTIQQYERATQVSGKALDHSRYLRAAERQKEAAATSKEICSGS